MVVKINFYGGKNQFSSPLTPQTSLPATRAGYACTGNRYTTHFDWLAFAVKLVRWSPNKFYRKCQPIKWECYLCTRSWHRSLHVSQGEKLIFTTLEIHFYHHGI